MKRLISVITVVSVVVSAGVFYFGRETLTSELPVAYESNSLATIE